MSRNRRLRPTFRVEYPAPRFTVEQMVNRHSHYFTHLAPGTRVRLAELFLPLSQRTGRDFFSNGNELVRALARWHPGFLYADQQFMALVDKKLHEGDAATKLPFPIRYGGHRVRLVEPEPPAPPRIEELMPPAPDWEEEEEENSAAFTSDLPERDPEPIDAAAQEHLVTRWEPTFRSFFTPGHEGQRALLYTLFVPPGRVLLTAQSLLHVLHEEGVLPGGVGDRDAVLYLLEAVGATAFWVEPPRGFRYLGETTREVVVAAAVPRVDPRADPPKRPREEEKEEEEEAIAPPPPKKARTEPSSTHECKICFAAPVNAAVFPCGHTYYCFACCMQLPAPRLCPHCRGTVDEVRRVYLVTEDEI